MIKPINKSVLLSKIEEEKTNGLKFTSSNSKIKMKVVNVADDCEFVKKDTFVYVDENILQPIEDYFIVSEKNIVAEAED